MALPVWSRSAGGRVDIHEPWSAGGLPGWMCNGPCNVIAVHPPPTPQGHLPRTLSSRASRCLSLSIVPWSGLIAVGSGKDPPPASTSPSEMDLRAPSDCATKPQWANLALASNSRDSSQWDEGGHMFNATTTTTTPGTHAGSSSIQTGECATCYEQHLASSPELEQARFTLPSHLVGNNTSLWGVQPSDLLTNLLEQPHAPAPAPVVISQWENDFDPEPELFPEWQMQSGGPHAQATQPQAFPGQGLKQDDWMMSAAEEMPLQPFDLEIACQKAPPHPRAYDLAAAPLSALPASTRLPSCVPSKEELELVQQLNHSRRKLDQLISTKHGKSATGAFRRKTAEGVEHMQRLVAALEKAVEQHQQLQGRWRQVNTHLALAEQQHRWMQLDAAHGNAPLVVSARLLATGQGGYSSKTRALGSGGLVSVFELPRCAAEWDLRWDDCVSNLGVLEMLHLHRQWLQRSAMLLPKVQLLKGTSEGERAKEELEELYERHNRFTQRVMRLAPDAWNESCKYDLDTMALLPQAPNRSYIDQWASCHFPEEWRVAQEILETYKKILTGLHQEQLVLQARYERLSARPSCTVADLSGGSCSSEDDATADEVLQMIQANISQQELQHNNCINAVTYMQPIEVMVTIKLTVYPLALNGQELL